MASADTGVTGVPALSSRAGAAYTIYLDFSGFAFTGTWGSATGGTPGTLPAYDGASGSFTSTQQSYIDTIWARTAEKYAAYNVNVTTVDPAVAGLSKLGLTYSDPNRQAYYDSTARMMHTVVGGTNASAGGVSFVGVTPGSYGTSGNGGAGYGLHTNFVYADESSTDFQFIAEDAAHENGHGFGLQHQADYHVGGTTVNEYSTNNNASGSGSFAPIMGDSYGVQRGTFRYGNMDNGQLQNDAQVIGADSGMTLVNDGIGHIRTAATALPLSGTSVNFNAAKGIIVPASQSNPDPIGVSNYTSDYFSFYSRGGVVSLTVNDGSENLTAGQADPGATLESTLSIFGSTGSLLATGTLSGSTLAETFTGTLPVGTYYAEINSIGGYTSTYDTSAEYYTMGSYFLTGSGFSAVPVPEPVSVAVMLLVGGVTIRRGRRVA